MKRRDFLSTCALAGLSLKSLALSSLANAYSDINTKINPNKLSSIKKANVVVVGGGFAGATAAKYMRILSENNINVTLIEPNPHFISCPISNRVIGGDLKIEDITLSYDNLSNKYDIKIISNSVKTIQNKTKGGSIICDNGKKINYDKLILAPGIDFLFDKIIGYNPNQHIHAWKAGKQTLQLRQQLVDMPDGGVYIISIPLAPYRCPPGPYERACLVANYFKQFKPKSKVIILDANPEIVSKPVLFKKIWQEQYTNIIEYHANFNVSEIDTKTNTVLNEVGDKFSANVLNILPPMQAGVIATQHGLGKVWCDIDYLTFESKKIKDIYIIGDAATSSPKMPKSAHIANQQGKYCAYSIIQNLVGNQIELPIYNNTCYSFANSKEAGHVSATYQYNQLEKNMLVVPDSAGVSKEVSILEGEYAKAWAKGIWLDTLF